MRTLTITLGLAVASIGLSGCGPSSAGPAAPALPSPQSTAEWKQVDNLEYLNWKKFPVGTLVVRTSTTTIGENSTTSVERFTLLESTDSHVTIERQNTTSRSDGSYFQANKPDTRKIAAKIPVHPELSADDFLKPDRKAKQTGKEKVDVLGTGYESVRWEWANGTDSGPMTVVSWLSEDVPGRIVKQEMKVAAIKSVTVETVTEWKKPN